MKSIYENKKVVSSGSQYDFAQRLTLYETTKQDFILEVTNYTQTIKLKDKTFMYTIGLKKPSMFVGYRMIETDLKNLQDTTKLEKVLNTVKKEDCKFYTTKYSLVPVYKEKAICIDLNNAYATILFNEGFISEKTKDYLLKLDKPERLAAVGMLATQKNIYYYNDGQITDIEIKENKYRPLFFYLVQICSKIMGAVEQKYLNAWFFTWVDGIYLDVDKIKKEEYLNIPNLLLEYYSINSKIEYLQKFDLQRVDKNIKVNFEKYNEKKQNWKLKTFNFPDPNMIINVNKLINTNNND
jgi:hypothetical protein